MPLTKHKSKLALLVDQGIYSALGFIINIYFARQLGIDNFAIYSTIVLFTFLVLSVSNALFINPFQILQASEKRINLYLSTLIIIQFAFIVVTAILIFLCFSIDSEIIKSIRPFKMPIILLVIGFISHNFLRSISLGMQKINNALIIDSLYFICVFVSISYLYISDNKELDLNIYAISISYIPPILVGVFLLKPALPSIIRIKKTLHRHLQIGRWLVLTSVVQWWSNNLIMVSSGLFLGIKSFGALRLAQTILGVINVILLAFENYTMPIAAKLFIDSKTKLESYLNRQTKLILIGSLPVLAILFLFSKDIFMFSGGAEFIEYHVALKGMALLYILILIGQPIRTAIRVMLLNKEFLTAYLVVLLFNLLLAKPLTQHFEITGIIIGLVLNQIILLSFWYYVLRKNKFHLWL